MDLDETEVLDPRTVGGADIVTVSDLTGTDVTVDRDLGGAAASSTRWSCPPVTTPPTAARW